MRSTLNLLATIIVIVWALGFFIYGLGGYFHWAMILALLVIFFIGIPLRRR